MDLILASASPRRSSLLRDAGFDFRIVPSQVEELKSGPEGAMSAALCNAMLKAEDVARRNPDSLVIGADTVIELDGETLGKPRDAEDAFRMLRRLSGREHVVSTGVSIRSVRHEIHVFFTDVSRVFFRNLADETIREYMRLVPVLDKAGAYGIQDHGDMLIERYEGSFENIMGLPVQRVAESLRQILG